ncbi:ABC transporter permease [Amycolatopsis sp. H20-H5]|uniref:ABC transporter permease n=1 Tax=Amycolatopsis sp. H20-H5 TaxID=3046309 RepID=UPI002DB56EA4|nr:ABC transporter permease [Amycolatopsis sp. H20-H5]MEC3979497.1 ABC transporter permease [Amycolatopsis sp. H20-H5]
MTVIDAATTQQGSPAPPQPRTEQWQASSVFTQTLALTGRSIRPYLQPGVLIITFIEPLVMLLMFGGVLRVLGEVPGLPSGVSYIDNLVPAIMVITAVAAGAQAGNGLIADLRNDVITRFHTMPIARFTVLLARSLADSARGLYQLIAVAILGALIFGFDPPGGIPGILGAILVSLIVGWSMSWIFITMAALLRNGDVLRMITTMLTFPLLFASNAFVPIDSLPSWLQVIANANPVSSANAAARGMATGQITLGQFVTTVLVCLAVVLVCGPVANRAFRVL